MRGLAPPRETHRGGDVGAEGNKLGLGGRSLEVGVVDFHQPPGPPRKDLLLLALFLWAWGFHFSSTTAGGDRDWLEAMLFSLSAAGTKGTVCFPEVQEACRLPGRGELERAGGGKTGLWDSGLGSDPGS